MLKIRLEGTPDDVKEFLTEFVNDYKVLQCSEPYKNRGASTYVRVYLDVDVKKEEQAREK